MRTFLGLLLGAALCWSTSGNANDLRFVTEEFFPFSYSVPDPVTGGSRAGGPLVEVVQLVCQRTGYRCSVEIHPWRRSLTLAEQGAVDGIFTVVRSPQRRQAFRLTPMLVRSQYGLFSQRNSSFHYQRPADLRGRTIGVYGPSGTSYALSQHLMNVPDARVHLGTDNIQLLRMLDSGRFGKEGLVAMNQDVARNLIFTEQLGNVRQAGELEPVTYGIGFSRKAVSKAEFETFRNALQAAMDDGSIGKILDLYGLEAAYRRH